MDWGWELPFKILAMELSLCQGYCGQAVATGDIFARLILPSLPPTPSTQGEVWVAQDAGIYGPHIVII